MYCTVDDLRISHPSIKLIQATDDVHPNELGTLNTAIAEEMIVLACGIIDGYLASVVTLPLLVVPVIIKKVAVDLTLYGLYERMGRVEKDGDMDLRRKNAIAMLERIANRTVSIGVPSDQTDSVGSVSSGALISSGRAEFTEFAMESLGGGCVLGRPW